MQASATDKEGYHVNLYVRLFLTWLLARFKPSIAAGEEIEMKLRVWPNDLDVNGHMNSGRYMNITDLAVIEYFTRSGFLPAAIRNRWRLIRSGTLISFKRELEPFKVYTLRFSIACWDRNWIYMRFVFERCGKVMAAGYVKGTTVGRAGVNAHETFAAMGLAPESPEFPASVRAWIEADRKIAREAKDLRGCSLLHRV